MNELDNGRVTAEQTTVWPATEWQTIVATPPTRKPRRWLVPVSAAMAVLLCTGAGVAATRGHDMVAPMVTARTAHLHAVAKAKADKAAKWAHDMHNPTVLEASVEDSYGESLSDIDGASIDHVTCLLISKANPNLFSCLITAISVYEDDPITASHDVLVSQDGTTWVAKS